MLTEQKNGVEFYSDSRRARASGLRDAGPRADNPEERMAAALGWFGIGLGLTEVFAPGAVSDFLGLEDGAPLVRAFGAREIASGVGILTQPRPVGWMWTRVAGDIMDLMALAAATPASDRRRRMMAATAMVAGITWMDLMTAQRMSTLPGQRRRDVGDDGTIEVRKAITIDKPAEEIYRFWRDFQNLPRIRPHLEEVRVTGDRTSHWVAKTAGIPIEWDAEIMDDQPNRRITWRSTPDSMIRNHGEVRFDPSPQGPGTTVRVEFHYHAPGGPIARALGSLIGKAPGEVIGSDLRPLKQLLETGEIATTEGQTSGRRSMEMAGHGSGK